MTVSNEMSITEIVTVKYHITGYLLLLVHNFDCISGTPYS